MRANISRPRSFVEPKPRLLRRDVLSLALHPPAERHEIASKVDQRARCDGARERLRDPHHSNVGIDRAVEGQVLRQRVDEHEGVVDVAANDRLLGARLRQPQPASRRWD